MLLPELNNYITRNNLIQKDDKILLAVSGGIDSMVMAHLFLRLPYFTAIAHCNFSLRGVESDGDEKLVRSFAEDHSIQFFNVRFDTKAYAAEKGISIQMAARELRYDWFEKTRAVNSFDSVAVAHNMNDNIETLLINLTRGTGPAGLGGMKPSAGRIIRPLLFAPRESIAEYCDKHSVAYREDRSNAETKYTRNKIRHLVIPILKEINPSIEKTLEETAERFSEINEIVTEYIESIREKVSKEKDGDTYIHCGLLKNYIENRSILFELFRIYGAGNEQLDDLVNVLNGRTGGFLITTTHRILKNRDEIIITKRDSADDKIFIAEDIGQLRKIPGILAAEIVIRDDSFNIPSESSTACFDLGKIAFPLTIRIWKAGDYFFPFGMKNQKKKLSDYFIDKKYSIAEKEHKKVLESEGEIAWVIGDRPDDRFRITGGTQKILMISLKNKTL